MNARLVGEGVAADDRLVPLHLHAGDVGHQPAGGHEPLAVDARVGLIKIAARAQRHDDFFQRAVAGPLADAVDRAFDLPGAVFDAARLLATASPRSLWQCMLITALSMFGTRSQSVRITLPMWAGVA